MRRGAAGPITLAMPRRYLDQRLKLSLLRVAEALNAHGSLLRASAALGVGQPALTRSLRELEEIVGTPLFERHARGVRPTQAGMAIIRLARRVRAELHRAEEELDTIGGEGTVAVGVLPVSAVGVLPGVLLRLKATHPAIRLRLEQGRTEELLPLLAEREIDLVVGRLYPTATPDGFVREALWEEPISLLARAEHPLLRREAPLSVADLAPFEFVLPTMSQRVGQEIEHFLTLLGRLPEASLRSSSYGLLREMLLATDCIAVMPRLMMVGDLLRGTLRVLPLQPPAPPRPAGLVLPAGGAPSPAAAAFIACLHETIAEITARGFADMPEVDSSTHKSDKTSLPRRR
ncbi:LysR family transcriptional regulator [Roseomonas sp. OT10]|uniref:LysR family transcriptional regulator n=1 Tax=Roseomonas cutis TaxID=2897332 RepID=UPI001E65452D|nr:LysR substrate-binding domain-containing protein [Roseomonas sp. OT10]UFN46867.1 LysR family transcriptional regulator [Roseomonas sp. OT10]